jgi:hypothetical protein
VRSSPNASEDPSLDVKQVLDEVGPQRQASIGAHLIRNLHEGTAGVTGILRSGHGNDSTLETMWDAWQAGHLE